MLRNNEPEILMITSPLSSNIHHRTMNNDNATVALLWGGLGGPWPLPDFWLAPSLATPGFCLISRSSSFDWHIQQITFTQQNFKRFEDFLATVLTIFTSLCWVW